MHRGDGGGREEIQREIAIGDGVQRVGGGAVEAQGVGGHVAVDRERSAGEGGRAERAFVHALAAIGQAAAVAAEHFDIGEHVVAEGDRLCRLQMGEAGHRVRRVFGGAVGEHAHDVGDLAVDAVDGVAHPEAEVGGDLVVAAAAGVQAFAGLADTIGEARLDVHVNVFEIGGEAEAARLDLVGDVFKPVADGGFVGPGDDALACQHGGVGARSGDVLAPHLAVEAN